jgi:TonB family protein
MTTHPPGTELINPGSERIGTFAMQDRRIWIALACAVLAHAAILIGFVRSPPRQIGDPNAGMNAVAVSFVTEAELNSRSTTDAGAAARQAAKPAPPPPPPQPPAAPAQEPAPATPQTAEPPPQQQAKAEEQLKSDVPDLLSLPDPAAQKEDPVPKKDAGKAESKMPEQTKPAPKKQQVARRPKLDLSMPAPDLSAPSLSGGGSAGFERPPGATRSGANDDFARGVIKALRATMPQLTDIRGRVTVRIILNDKGNIGSVEVTNPSEIAELNQSVLFSTKQASFPIPPNGSTLADRTFTVTYNYR